MKPESMFLKAKSLYDEGMSSGDIAKATGKTVEQITNLIMRERKKARRLGLPNPFPYRAKNRQYDDNGVPISHSKGYGIGSNL